MENQTMETDKEQEEQEEGPYTNPEEEEEYKRVGLIFRTLIKLGSAQYYLPFRYNSETGKTSVIHTKSHAFGRWLVAFTSTIYTLGPAAILMEQAYFGRFSIFDIGSFSPMLSLPLAGFCLLFQLNTLLKAEEWAGFCNSMQSFGMGFEARNQETMKKRSPLMEGLMLATIINVELIGLICVIIFGVQCNVNPLKAILPICDAINPSNYRSTAVMIPILIGVYWLGTRPQTTNCIFVAVVLLEAVFGTQRTFGEMRKQVESGISELSPESSHQWNLDYRSMQFILTQINACIRDWVIPIFLFTVIVVMVTINYLLITQNVHFVMDILWLTINLTLLFYLVVVVHLSSAFLDESVAVVEMRRASAEAARDFQTEKFMQSCTPFRIWVGGLFYFTKHLVPSILETVTSTTIDTILL